VVALSNNLYIVMFGVFIGILTMRFAAGIFTWMILREPILKPAAYLVVFNIGAELLLDEFMGIEISGGLKFVISAATLILFVVYAHIKPLHVLQPVFDWLAEGMADVNELLDWLLIPVKLALKLLFRAIGFGIKPIVSFFRFKSADRFNNDQVIFDIDCDKKKKKAVKP
jgi:tellurite resistance protein TerC